LPISAAEPPKGPAVFFDTPRNRASCRRDRQLLALSVNCLVEPADSRPLAREHSSHIKSSWRPHFSDTSNLHSDVILILQGSAVAALPAANLTTPPRNLPCDAEMHLP